MNKHLNVLYGALAMLLAGPVCATTTWGLHDTPSTGVSIAAVANTDGTNVANNAAVQKIEAAEWVSTYGGINNADNPGSGRLASDIDASEGAYPEHAIDNNERYEMVLLTFSEKVNLSAVNLNWRYGSDSDITVMAFQGATGSQGLIGKTWSTLDSGWNLISHYNNVPTNTNYALGAGAAGIYSSFWLIGAYNPLVGGSAASGLDIGDDYVKLASVTGTVCPPGNSQCSPPSSNVPEPGSFALVGLGLLGVMRLRKARQA
ncbi:MAG: PEP-CTERM sorting domain-containing protein [Gammaproteobacteria bacterium]|nr:PEP-CTERM sorting domain-containing protein [Gammaproteobacteria bacterium]MBU1603217.1 PEP-CTERM sorting domain-containing protein [Gammaproteobacteria bacterium]MBU2432737.1 PEP-CTERM sorting domain-containing protein [Gammaproteobacteria bacterium]MBU2451568.1 PEP-CTERM sorting domain-containing protein [Gammaproteobacteria bacterium]